MMIYRVSRRSQSEPNCKHARLSAAWDLTTSVDLLRFVFRGTLVGGVLGLDRWVDILHIYKRILVRGKGAYVSLRSLGGVSWLPV